MKTSEIIKNLRKKTSLKHKHIADVLGMSRSNYGNKENGKISFTADELFLVLEFLRKHVTEEEYLNSITDLIGSQSQAVKTEIKKSTDQQKQKTPVPMDSAIQILQEALEETGVKINEKQKQAVLKILREELAKSENKTKDDIKKYLQIFGK
ncbi:helix-turn-helix domain-containing protein [Desulfobacula phenolica]|uniref:HTH cro/C1-type domain-containing protein n=1 Tax=Desulfobacula phenolica TaxID=90732 RepID=A0A1H2I4N8_9BACT|nr:hypothetical protein SAMN04487931_107225 [Desulfobacula phenolica]